MLAVVLAAATTVRGAVPPETGAVATANTAFAVDLYRQLSPAAGNLVFSPYSISDVLAMAQVGARGQTAAEMAGVLHLGLPGVRIAAGFAGLGKSLDGDNGDGITLVTANSLWSQAQFPLRDEYLQVVRTQFGAEAMPADFVRNAGSVRTAINVWANTQTRGKIPELIGAGMLDAQTRMVLCNAVYFRGRWAHQFKIASTRPAPFRLSPHVNATVPMMQQKSSFRNVHIDALSLLELPYEGQALSLVIVLPDAVDGLPEIERQLTGENLRAWLAQLDFATEIETSVHLPRFAVNRDFRLDRQLSLMGLRSAFDPANADFSGITGDRSLVLSAVIHQAMVEANEEGTVAAASTGAIMTFGVTMQSHEVWVDHPFFFLIRDNATGTILFLGRIVDPR